MKKILLTAALALACAGASAQNQLNLSTFNGTNLAPYANKTLNAKVARYLFHGWNTISLPFDVPSAQINEVFGHDCKLECLAGVENDGKGIKLNFRDCKGEGIKANVPYILYYAGEAGRKTLSVPEATIVDAKPELTFTAQGTGETVTMGCAKTKRESKGMYGILASDNSEAAFVNVDNVKTGFYATHCYIQLSNGNSTVLNTNHIGSTVSIHNVLKDDEHANVYNVSGVMMAKDATINEILRLQPGVYVIKGKKVSVK